jgi:hypothetical protein
MLSSLANSWFLYIIFSLSAFVFAPDNLFGICLFLTMSQQYGYIPKNRRAIVIDELEKIW